MLRSMVLLVVALWTLMLSAIPGLGAEGSYQGVFFSVPPGWTSGMQDGRFILAPEDMTDETAVVVVLYGAEKLGGKPLDDWFRSRMNSDVNPPAKVLNDDEIKSTRVGELQMLTTARAVQDGEGNVRIHMYHAVSDGQQAALAMGVTASEKAIDKYAGGIQAFFGSLHFSPSLKPGANSLPSPDSSSAPSGSGSRQVTTADLTGRWMHSTLGLSDYVMNGGGADVATLTKGYGKEYTFAADGTYKYRIDSAISVRSLTVTESDSGTWGFERSMLVLKSKERDNTMNFYIIECQKAPDGTDFLILLNDMYPPTASNIHDYGYHFVRVAARR